MKTYKLIWLMLLVGCTGPSPEKEEERPKPANSNPVVLEEMDLSMDVEEKPTRTMALHPGKQYPIVQHLAATDTREYRQQKLRNTLQMLRAYQSGLPKVELKPKKKTPPWRWKRWLASEAGRLPFPWPSIPAQSGLRVSVANGLREILRAEDHRIT